MMPIAEELTIDVDATAMAMAEAIFGNGVSVSNATYSGDDASSGIYSGGTNTAGDVLPSDSGVILSTGNAVDFTNSDGTTNTNQVANRTTDTVGGIDGDTDFDGLAGGANTFDAAFLEVEFEATGNLLTIDFVIASEEYPEYISSQFNDLVGVWVNGVQATVTVGDGSASVGNINGDVTENIYNDNLNDQFNTEMDGFTVTLTFVAPVQAGTNTLKIGVADVADAQYDTNLLIAGDSVQTVIVAQDDSFDAGVGITKTINVLDNDSSDAPGILTVTHINGEEVFAGDTVELATGQFITLNANGTFEVTADTDVETVYFNYTVEDSNGETDTALVQLNQIIPCFTPGTLINTPNGATLVENLRAGDIVLTADNGPQPIRWMGQKSVAATGDMTPVRIAKGTLGCDADLLVSPQHRVLISGSWAELMFGESEVLVKAKDLINDQTIRRCRASDTVTYIHILFDQHQLVTSNGILTESYHIGPHTMAGFDAATQAEIHALFPELTVATYDSYMAAARLSLKPFEARALAKSLSL
jgi:hypothetical protein